MISQINWLKLSLQKSIEREEQIERELQAEKARADELSGKTGQLEAAEAKVAELVGALENVRKFLPRKNSLPKVKTEMGDAIAMIDKALAKGGKE